MACPACGAKDVKSVVRCGKYRAHICMKHCYEGCEYFSDFGGSSIVHCFFRDKLIEKHKKDAAEQALQEYADSNK